MSLGLVLMNVCFIVFPCVLNMCLTTTWQVLPVIMGEKQYLSFSKRNASGQ